MIAHSCLECNPNNCSSSIFVDIIMCQWWSLITYEMISQTGLARRALLGLQKRLWLKWILKSRFCSPKTCSLGPSVFPKVSCALRLGNTTQKYGPKYSKKYSLLKGISTTLQLGPTKNIHFIEQNCISNFVTLQFYSLTFVTLKYRFRPKKHLSLTNSTDLIHSWWISCWVIEVIVGPIGVTL